MAQSLFPGVAAAAAAALIAALWQLTARHGVTTTLGPMELAVLRYGIPAVALLPLLVRTAPRWRALPWGVQLALFTGGGLPFGLLVLAGAQFAPAAHMGIFMAGTMPVFTGLASHFFLGEQLTRGRIFGLVLVALGAAVLAGTTWTAQATSWRGDLLFVLAAAMWAAYTIAFRRSGLAPWEGAAFVNGTSALLLVPLALLAGIPRLATAPLADIALQAAGQGVLAGLLGLVVYSIAIRQLGAARASLSAAAVPLLTAAGGAWILGEQVSPALAVAVVLATAGIAL
ncbi:MAG: DMT family transporter, partial [Burkholderiaceae bacterium]